MLAIVGDAIKRSNAACADGGAISTHGRRIDGASPQEVFVPYVYDGNGFPRWVYGQRAFDGGAAALTLQWFDGFCPTCAVSGLVPTAAGSGTRSLVTNGVSAMSSSLAFTGALSGAWNQSRPVAMLSQPKSCE